jgi:hypothetical protein
MRWGFENCADWLHWRCDLSLSAAREKVRVAHALKTLPRIGMAFAEGALSYSKVRALTRVASRETEEKLLEFALHTTAARVEARCRELRCGTQLAPAMVHPPPAQRRRVRRRRTWSLHVDAAALRGGAGRSGLPIETMTDDFDSAEDDHSTKGLETAGDISTETTSEPLRAHPSAEESVPREPSLEGPTRRPPAARALTEPMVREPSAEGSSAQPHSPCAVQLSFIHR